jgi:hypothetical protein
MNMSELYCLCRDEDLTVSERVSQVLLVLKRPPVVWSLRDGRLAVTLASENPTLKSNWLLPIHSGSKVIADGKLDQQVEMLLVAQRIAGAVNSIAWPEDRLVFVERQLSGWPVSVIMRHHYLSQRAYYNAINRGLKQFAKDLQIY